MQLLGETQKKLRKESMKGLLVESQKKIIEGFPVEFIMKIPMN